MVEKLKKLKWATSSNTQALSGLGAVVMERESLMRDLLAAIPGQPLPHTTASSAQLDGLAPAGPSSAPPPPITTPSGISRPQFLVAAQAASLPCFPSYTQQDGGAVLDRVIFHAGGDKWWSTLTGRVKLQRLLGRRKTEGWKKAFQTTSGYALCHNTSIRLPHQSLLKTKVAYLPRKRAQASGDSGSSSSSTQAPAPPPLRVGSWQGPPWLARLLQEREHMQAVASFRRNLKRHEIRVDTAVNQQDVGGGDPLPLAASAEIRSASKQLTTLHYRLGVHHLMTKASGGTNSSIESSSHLHATLAAQGHRSLWNGNPATRQTSNARRQSRKARPQKAQSGAQPAEAGSTAGADSNGSATLPRGKVLGPHNPIRQVLQKLLLPGGSSDAQGALNGSKRSDTEQQVQVKQQATSAGGSPVPQPEEVQELVMDATQSIKRLREDVQSLADWVGSGAFTQQLEQSLGIKSTLVKSKPGLAKSKQPVRTASARTAPAAPAPIRAPWSSLVGTPHLKVAGLLGVHLRQPLLSLRGAGPDIDADADALPARVPGGAGSRIDRANSLATDLVRSSVAWIMQTAGSAVGQEAGRSARGPKAAVFASVAASAQLGWFQRPLLDFTRATAQLDLGLQGQPATGSVRDWSWLHSRLPTWHALTVSLSQQLLGPVRLCADMRYSLEPGGSKSAGLSSRSPPPSRTSALGSTPLPALPQHSESVRVRAQQAVTAQLQGAAAQVRGTRPQLVEATVGLDVVLPGSNGFARLMAWYSPLRKEGMLELRLL